MPAATGDQELHGRGVSLPSPPGVAGLGNAVKPFTNTGQYVAQSWREYRDQEPGGLPLARPTLALAAQAFRDEIVLIGLKARRPVSRPEAFERISREVAAAVEFYGARGWLDNPKRFFAAPPKLSEVSVRKPKGGKPSLYRIFFDSGYRPRRGEPGAQRYMGYTANEREYALLLRHPQPRPWLVCVHGTEMGRAAMDLAIFRAWRLHEVLGLNVVMPVLPMHGPRARHLPKAAVFPGEDVLDDVHATAQAVWDIRRLLSWIRSEEPESQIGLYGLSMGGYIAGLLAGLERGLTCAILGVPVADLVGLLGRHSGLGSDDPRRHTMEIAARIGQMTSPLSLRPLVPQRGRFIYAGVADQVVHPREQVVRLWEHWGKPEIVWYSGGHTGFFRARPVQRFVEAALAQSGLLDGVSASRDRPA
ncbi:prolyl oligopeptidase family protein [Mycobacterium bohemicum DSM 44277]|uniref:Esterase n=2 Tax=Mycobacterium bohemicum TaxID=56425 RepID=A0A1X1R3B1_MYCBE|nr:hypothetical protein [Mycobacterium bohemicum]MCV6970349.1 hypothetical protein [Mycobacterium bohemicum]ORU98704.1 hypothetical protein AWB93_12655 [Mycobacterium bohemicum]CPR12347.1 prolyl oligopeptidase family protein [Mycobacterium bohemicum DSM 44277]